MSELSNPPRWKALAFVAGLALAISVAAIWAAASAHRATLGFVTPILLVSAAALLAVSPLLLLSKVRQQRDFAPRWYVGRAYLLLATWPAILILLLLGSAAWLAGSSIAAIVFEAALIAIVVSALLSIWTHIGLILHRLVRRPTPEPPPAAH